MIWAWLALIPRWVSWTALGAAVSLGLWMVKDYRDLSVEVVELRQKRATQANTIKVLETNLESLQGSFQALDKQYTARLADLDQYCAILREVQDSKDPKDRDPVGGAVGKVLERLDKKARKK